MTAGKIIFLHGASSSGKSTIARQLQATIDEPFWHISIDHLRDSGVLPMERFRSGEFHWQESRTRGDRARGDARRDFETIHRHAVYDLEIDATLPPAENAAAIIAAWKQRRRPSAFERLADRSRE